jgi:exonuclease-1
MGFRTAVSLLRKHRDMARVLRVLRLERRGLMPQEYERAFQDAERTFLHHRVFDAELQSVVHLHPLPEELCAPGVDLSFLGSYPCHRHHAMTPPRHLPCSTVSFT